MLARSRPTFALVLGLLTAGTAPLHAQHAPSRIVSVNPFLPLAGSFQGEFEQKVRDNLSVAVSASYLALDDSDRFTNADLKLRLYPSEKALQGFAIASGIGVGRQSDSEYTVCPAVFPSDCVSRRGSVTGPTFSVEMQYQWLLGSKRSTAVTIGGGAKRHFIDDAPDGYNQYEQVMRTLRLTIGYAFR